MAEMVNLFKFIFLLKDNCFTQFCCFLSNPSKNLPRYTYIPSLLTLPPKFHVVYILSLFIKRNWTKIYGACFHLYEALLLLWLSLQSWPTLCDPRDGSPPGSPIPGILQARTLEWVAISFSKAWKWKVTVKSLSHVWLFETPWTSAYQAPPSMGFSRQEYWSGVPLPSPMKL